jgi:peptidoglycan-N-acetylglucosamine deacetylase
MPETSWQKEDWEASFGRREEVEWQLPAGTRMVVTLTFDTQGDVDAAIEGTTGRWKNGEINYADLTQRQYDVTAGIARVLRVLDEHNIKATFPTCGLTAEWYPGVVETIRDRGHELAVHGHTHALLHTLKDAEIEEEIDLATQSISKVVGGSPKGWVSPVFSITPFAFREVLQHDYAWNSDFHNDDVPYILNLDGRRIVQLPVGMNDWDLYLLNDVLGARMGGVPYASPSHVTDILVSQFDQLYSESSEQSPRVFHYCMHPKITGRPYRMHGFQKFLAHAMDQSGVVFMRCGDLAAACI